MLRLRAAAALLSWIGMAAIAVQAQPPTSPTPMPPDRPHPDGHRADTPRVGADTPPDQVKLERLAEVMGVLTFLRDLCEPGDGAVWRGKMEDLLASEGVTPSRRDRLAGAFNRGFSGYRASYRQCTPAAELAIGRALGEGAALARDLSTRFGG